MTSCRTRMGHHAWRGERRRHDDITPNGHVASHPSWPSRHCGRRAKAFSDRCSTACDAAPAGSPRSNLQRTSHSIQRTAGAAGSLTVAALARERATAGRLGALLRAVCRGRHRSSRRCIRHALDTRRRQRRMGSLQRRCAGDRLRTSTFAPTHPLRCAGLGWDGI